MLNIEDKQGYKYTEEFGYIPEDWEVKPLESYVNKIGDIDHYMPPTTNYGIPYIMTGDFIGNNELDYYGAKKVSFSDYDKLSKKIKPEYNDIIIARYASVGEIRIVKSTKPFLVSYSCAIIKTNKNLMNPNYLAYYMKSDLCQNLLALEINASTQKNIGIDTLKTISVLAPINKIEQEKIAEMLGDVDSLIDKTQQLINKKKDLKTATMHKLLTPKEDWITDILGNVCEIKKGSVITSQSMEEGDIPVIAGGKTPAYYNNKYNRDGKTITISASGASAGYVWFHNYPIYASDCSTISESSNYCIEFIYYFLLSKQNYIYNCQAGGAQPHIHPSDLEPLILNYPSDIKIQEQIATILSDMDSEIEALEKELNKYKDLKTGMMQQLLTGKVRLI